MGSMNRFTGASVDDWLFELAIIDSNVQHLAASSGRLL